MKILLLALGIFLGIRIVRVLLALRALTTTDLHH